MEETYGQQVLRLRKRQGWTQTRLAQESGVPLRTLQNIEGDKHKQPQRATVLALNRVLGIEGDPEKTREEWPQDVKVYLDIMGAFLANMPEQRRMDVMREITTRILSDG